MKKKKINVTIGLINRLHQDRELSEKLQNKLHNKSLSQEEKVQALLKNANICLNWNKWAAEERYRDSMAFFQRSQINCHRILKYLYKKYGYIPKIFDK